MKNILEDLEILILQNEDDFDRGSGKFILRNFIKEKQAEQLTLTVVSQQRELLIDFSKKIMFGEDWTPPLPYEQMVDDYLKGN